MARQTLRLPDCNSLAARISCTGEESASGGQLQERNHAFLQCCSREIQNLIQRLRIGHVELAGDGAPKRGEVRAAAEFLAEVMRHAANVRALGASEFERADGFDV